LLILADETAKRLVNFVLLLREAEARLDRSSLSLALQLFKLACQENRVFVFGKASDLLESSFVGSVAVAAQALQQLQKEGLTTRSFIGSLGYFQAELVGKTAEPFVGVLYARESSQEIDDKQVILFALEYENVRRQATGQPYKVFQAATLPQKHKSWASFKKAYTLCRSLGAEPADFIQAQFAGLASWSRCSIPFPNHLHSKGAADRYHAWMANRGKARQRTVLAEGEEWIKCRERKLQAQFFSKKKN